VILDWIYREIMAPLADLENTLLADREGESERERERERVAPWSKPLAVHLDYSMETGVRAIKCAEVSRAVDLQNI